ncbi:MAG TPA: hypothetical protein VK116_13175, partial [Planctomycetota bacterium]|nr:hypothetical protein [Planctomycetota bacterium]
MRRSDPEAGTRKASSGLDEQELQEIVASELESSGVQDADLARRLVGRLLSFVDPKPALSFREIENILFGAGSDGGEHDEPSTPKKVRDRVAEHVLAAYALQEVTPRAAVRASAAGRIHLHAIESPVRLETLRLRLPRIGSDGLRSTLSYDRLPFTSRTVSRESFDLATFLTSVARLRQYTSGELAISGLPALLFDPVTQGRDAEEKARDVIERLARFPSRPTIVLELGPDDDASTWLRALTGLPESHTRSLVFRLRGVGADPLRRGAIGRAVGLASRLHARGERLEFYPAPIYARFP